MLSRAIMAPRDLILDTAEAQRMSLFFDHILIYSLSRKEFSKEENKRFVAEIEYLRENGVALSCALDIPNIISFGTSDGKTWNPRDEIRKNCDLMLPFAMDTGGPKQAEGENHADRLIRHLSRQLMYNDHPVAAHASGGNLSDAGQRLNTLEVTINNIPLPPENIPWDDLIQFRNEEENIAKLRALRLWLKDRASTGRTPREIQEELEHLLYEYRRYMEIQHKKFSQGALSSLISATPEIVANVASLNFGAAIKTIFDIKGRHLNLSEAEIAAPGREVSYIAKSESFVSR